MTTFLLSGTRRGLLGAGAALAISTILHCGNDNAASRIQEQQDGGKDDGGGQPIDDAGPDAPPPDAGPAPPDKSVQRETLPTTATLWGIANDPWVPQTYIVGDGVMLSATRTPDILTFWEPFPGAPAGNLRVVDALDHELCVADSAGAASCIFDSDSAFHRVTSSAGPIVTILASPRQDPPRQLGGLFIASDGSHWTLNPSYQLEKGELPKIPFAPLATLTYGVPETRLAAGEHGVLATYAGGAWSEIPSGTTSTLRTFGAVGGKFWAAGDDGAVVTSPDDVAADSFQTLRHQLVH